MARLTWNTFGTRFFETGVDKGVLFIDDDPGVAWPGLLSVSERPSGGDPRPYYIDGVKFLNLATAEEFEASITAFSCPSEFGPCDGNVSIQNGLIVTAQPRQSFGFSYRTRVGNEVDREDHSYKIHIVYNALAAPPTITYNTIDDSIEPVNLSWAITTLPPEITGYKRTAHLVIDARNTDPEVLTEVEDLLYGTEIADASLPTPDELIAIFTP